MYSTACARARNTGHCVRRSVGGAESPKLGAERQACSKLGVLLYCTVLSLSSDVSTVERNKSTSSSSEVPCHKSAKSGTICPVIACTLPRMIRSVMLSQARSKCANIKHHPCSLSIQPPKRQSDTDFAPVSDRK